MAKAELNASFGISRLSICILILSSCFALLFSIFKRIRGNRAETAFGARHGCLPPPELQNERLFGLDWVRKLWKADAEQHLLQFLSSVADGYEPRNMLSQYLLVGPRAYHIIDPLNLETVLSTNFDDYGFGVRHGVFSPLLGTGIFTQEGAAWKHSRELIRSQFVRAQYRDLEPFRDHVDNLIENIERSAANSVVDLQPLFFKLTLDTTTALLLGHSVYSLKAGRQADASNIAFADNFNLAQGGLAKRFRMAPWHFLYSPPQFRRACSSAQRFVEQYIDERGHTEVKDSESFIDQLAQGSTSRFALRDQLLNILLAGRDTTACCLSWAMRLLIRHPLVMQKVQEEIRSVMGSDNEHPSREQIRKMPYLSLVIKESLRLFPPVPLNNRTANKTTILPRGGGPDAKSPILVRKGELVVFSPYVAARRKSLFGSDADAFRPERWQCKTDEQCGWAYAPFNRGPRACLGQDFALMEVSYTIVRLLLVFPNIKLPEDEDYKEILGGEKQRLSRLYFRPLMDVGWKFERRS